MHLFWASEALGFDSRPLCVSWKKMMVKKSVKSGRDRPIFQNTYKTRPNHHSDEYRTFKKNYCIWTYKTRPSHHSDESRTYKKSKFTVRGLTKLVRVIIRTSLGRLKSKITVHGLTKLVWVITRTSLGRLKKKSKLLYMDLQNSPESSLGRVSDV